MRIALCLILLATAACGGANDGPDGGAGSELAEVALRPTEVPEGLELDEDAGGPVDSLREILPPVSDAPQLPQLPMEVRRSFSAGYDAVYRSEGEGEGIDELTSSVIRFSAPEHAATFLAYLREIQSASVALGSSRQDVEVVEAPTLGEGGYGFHRAVPGVEISGFAWHRDDLVLTLTLSGEPGSAATEVAADLARSMDQRLA